jgi:hypothetical protein
MPERKYAKYIITTPKPPQPQYLKKKEDQKKSGSYTETTRMFSLDDSVAKGAFYTDCVWVWSKKGPEAVKTEIAHTHDFDEVLGFIGTVRNDPFDLGGEIEFWLGDEQYIFSKSCLIFVPRGLKHLPLIFRRVDSPIFFFTEGNGTTYTRSSGKEY